MKTKLKKSSKNEQGTEIKKLLKNNNFRNNQNYILGKGEKKKILSKFFIEIFLLSFYKFSSTFFNIFYYIFKFIVIISIIFWLFIISPLFIPILFIIFLLYIINKYKNIKD